MMQRKLAVNADRNRFQSVVTASLRCIIQQAQLILELVVSPLAIETLLL